MHEQQTQSPIGFDRLHDVSEWEPISGDVGKIGNDLGVVRRCVDGLAHDNRKPIPLVKKSPSNVLRITFFPPLGLKLFKLFSA